jgi:hypothetical protein
MSDFPKEQVFNASHDPPYWNDVDTTRSREWRAADKRKSSYRPQHASNQLSVSQPFANHDAWPENKNVVVFSRK